MKVFFAFSHTRPIISFQCQFSSTSKVSFEMFEISSNQDHWWSQTDKIVWPVEIRQIFWLLPTTPSLPRKRQRQTLLLLLHSDWLFLVKGFSSFLLGDVWQGVRHYYYPHRERKECRNHSSQKCWSRDPLSCWQQRALWSTVNRVLSHWRSKRRSLPRRNAFLNGMH